MPHCKFCDKQFTTWRSFAIHVQRGCQAICPAPLHLDRWCPDSVPSGMPIPPEKPPALDAVVRGSKLLSASDLQNIMHQEWGRRLLVIVGHRHWHHLRLEHAANDYLSKRCCLCDQWVGRAQEMHKHMRLFHAAYWPNVMAKSQQFSNLYANEGPCSFCKCVFKKVHSCNVWTQVALLLLGGAGTTESTQDVSPNLTCEICNETLDSVDDMHRHLAVEHKLTRAQWNVSRDAQDGQPICAHCQMEFGTMASLRSHIVQGRCVGYDPSQSTEPLPVKEQWKHALCHGALRSTLQDAQVRLALTLYCQCCTQKYSRAGDLALHLQSSHSTLWAMSEPLTMYLVAQYYSIAGCCCNPATSIKRLNHICLPLRQLSMQFFRLDPDALFMPHAVSETDLTQIYHADIPRSLKFHLDSLLSERNLGAVWTNEELLQDLRETCVLCSMRVHPAELGLHLREAHQCSSDSIRFHMHRLLPEMMKCNETDFRCFACLLTFNNSDTAAPSDDEARKRMVQAHYKAQCPTLLQLAVILSRAAHGGGSGHDGPARCNRTSPGHLQADGTNVGSQPATVRKPGASEAPAKRRRSQSGQAPAAFTRSGEGHDSHGPSGDTPRPGDTSLSSRRYLPALFRQQRENSSTTIVGSGSFGLASANATESRPETPDAAAPAPAADLDEGAADSSNQVGRSGCQLRSPEGGLAESGVAAEPHLPLPGMGSSKKGLEDQLQAASQSPTSGGQRPGVSGDVHTDGPDLALSLPSFTSNGDSMEAPAQHPSRSGVRAHEDFLSVQYLDTHGGDGEEPQPSSKWPGDSTGCHLGTQPDEGQEQRTRQGEVHHFSQDRNLNAGMNGLDRFALLRLVANMVLMNPDNWCFANASVFSLLWTTLSLRAFDHGTWGKQCDQFCTFLAKMETADGNLSTEDWFKQVLRCWGKPDVVQLVGSISQHDAAEFISVWLEQLNSPAFRLTWERRLEENGCVHKIDECVGTMPLFFQFDAFTLQLPSFTLSMLARTWNQVDGMQTGLTQLTDCICVHIDRCVQDSSGRVTKCTNALLPESEFVIPILMNDRAHCQCLEFTVTAMMAHLGGDECGHYRTALHLHPGTTDTAQPYQWLMTDDWSKAMPLWSLPDWFMKNVTMIWGVRSDKVLLFDPGSPPIPPIAEERDPVADMLELLPQKTKADADEQLLP